MENTTEDAALPEEANRRYWGSGSSVNQIAEELELSKGSLYSLIRPLRSGLPCPECGSETVYPNRTAREKGFLTCPTCGMEDDEETIREAWGEAGEAGGGAVVVTPATWREAHERPVLQRVPGRFLLGSALLGVAAGIVLASVLRRR